MTHTKEDIEKMVSDNSLSVRAKSQLFPSLAKQCIQQMEVIEKLEALAGQMRERNIGYGVDHHAYEWCADQLSTIIQEVCVSDSEKCERQESLSVICGMED